MELQKVRTRTKKTPDAKTESELKVVGTSVRRVDGWEKITRKRVPGAFDK